MSDLSNRPEDPGEKLRAEIRDKIDVFMTSEDVTGSERQLAEIKRLDSVLSAYERTKGVRTKPKWPIALVFFITVLIIAVLLFDRVDHTEVTLDLQVSELEFLLESSAYLTQATSVSRLLIDGINEIQLWPGAPEQLASLDPGSNASLIDLVVDNPNRDEAIYLGPLKLPAATVVYVPAVNERGELRMNFRHASQAIALQATLPRELVLKDPCNTGQCAISLDRERPLNIVSNLAEVDVAMMPLLGKSHVFQQEIPIGELSVRYSTNDEGMVPRKLSTILGGTIYFEALVGRNYELRRGEHVEIDFDGPATLAELSVTPDGTVLRVNGVAGKLEVGSQTNLRSLMPRWLEWLQSRHEVSLFWGSVTYLFLLLLGVLRWWGFNG